MLQIKNIFKSYGEEKILNGITLNIEDGDIFGIIGQSGTGKSTILRCINGTEKISDGQIFVDGQEINSLSERDLRTCRKNMGFIFQHFSLMERDTVFQNIARPMKCWKYKKAEIEERVNELLKVVGLEEKANQKPRELSGGQKQRVAIARALAMKPHYILCDEATSALDPKTTRSILSLLKEINEKSGVTIIIVTHEMSVIREICNKVAVLAHGRIAAEGFVEDVFAEASDALTELTGEKEYETLPQEGINVNIHYKNTKDMNESVEYLIKQKDVSLLSAKTERYRNSTLGKVIVNLPENNKDEIFTYLIENNYSWEVLDA